MSQEETSQFRAEIARLNKIINVLLEQNDAIKAAYSQLLLRFEANQPIDRKVDAKTGLSRAINSHLDTHLGSSSAIQSQLPTEFGVNQAIYSPEQTHLGVNKPLHPDTQTPLPLNTISQTNSHQSIPPQQQTVVLPEQIVPSNALFASVAQKLEAAGFTRVKKGTRQTAAQLFIHFHNGGKGDYAGLQQLTGYSAGGLGKLLITLRKRGFIQRTGYGKYGLTEQGNDILIKALGTENG